MGSDLIGAHDTENRVALHEIWSVVAG